MSAMRDIKYIAHLEYDIMDTYNLIINLKRKKKELEIILDDYC